jgi:diadenosine tetraphosphatase ApaH/serine/threonine PP2A family protein phosphatase
VTVRALIISDIHANLQALEAVLAAAPQHDAIWNLGDIVGYGANPNEVVELVRKLKGIVVRGNHDRACSDPLAFSHHSRINPTAATAAIWTDCVLTNESREWLSGLPCGPIKPLRRSLICVHGSPRDEDEYIFFREDALTVLRASQALITFCGHTHWQVGWSLNGPELTPLKPDFRCSTQVEHFSLSLRRGRRYIINPGSVGQPRDGDWRAAFALYDDAQRSFTWFRVPYEVDIAQRRVRQAGLPEILAPGPRECA